MTARELPSDPPGFDDPEVVNPYLLPDGVRPRRYDLTLEPDLAGASFTGSVAISLDIDGPTSVISCNALDLTIDRGWVIDESGRSSEASDITLDPEAERVTFTFDEPMSGAAVLHIEFAGELNDKLRGFYRSTFTDAEGVEQVIATTQFEATDARRAFPCWDEPAHKASFAVTLVVAADLFAVSNAAELSRTPLPDRPDTHVVRFAETMVMSTYLVAFVVGPLEATDPIDVDGTPLRIVFPRGKGHLTHFALEVAAAGLRHFAEYYGIAYPGDKLDLVAVPDFAFGAMENLGCITFREILLLVDPDSTTQAELLNVTDVINHELAHMWFGDLVTMRWWNGIWLNEAFATFMEMHATDAFRPRRSTPTPWPVRARSSTRSCPPPMPRGCSTSSPMRRALQWCACSRRTSSPRCSAPVSAGICPPTPTATPRPPISGTPSRPRAVIRCAASWIPGSSRVGIRSSRLIW
ncbi:MAG: hypothetical protein EBX39_01675 [Actinobacteria bacterium]|nr:hypothetical protein [Actinomycetota bacterium]